MSMTFDEYQQKAEKTAIYPDCGTGSITALCYVGLGLSEAGEVQGKIKKILRDDGGKLTPEKAKEIAKEVGDVLWYCAMTARELGVSLDEIAEANIAKLASRQERSQLTGSGDNR